MPLFEVCVLHEKSKKKEEEVVIWPTRILAKDEKAAAFQFLLELNEDEKDGIDLKRAKVLVRPF